MLPTTHASHWHIFAISRFIEDKAIKDLYIQKHFVCIIIIVVVSPESELDTLSSKVLYKSN